ncbi:uncharacterized protein At1g66480-like [Curcuma longa]|uniref:uncharacterized protein At1g66480-like n=1 Tax=Curcuma longa TaxID=136217 RepID=UPI003D9E9D5F
MGNGLSRKKKFVKVMKLDGSTIKLKSPALAGQVLEDYPGYNLLDSDDVTRSGVRARPLDQDAALKPGKLYFLVQLPRLKPTQAAAADSWSPAGRAWSGALRVSAKERLESLKISRRTMSDVSSVARRTSAMAVDEAANGVVQLKMRLPKSQVEKLMRESRSPAEAAKKITELCIVTDGGAAAEPAISAVTNGRKEKRTRFAEIPDEIIA